ncbi:(2Fe-2S)-binding protein [Terrimonas pollutisoli]|uniref:(2Fe-2S)-binding protein n=1 Tax=Terrimonas pollutisoli TaxID=3034147 RepID=UPI0023EDCD8A|nr:(2Fe-2S)-binding protein [Terrimonas sp. H1YJ31]
MSIKITVTVNGVKHTDKVEPRLLLVHYLRDVLRLTGTHVGCDTSSCGSCTIHVNGKATKSCTLLAVQADKTKITTIEGLSTNGELHPLQDAFNQCHGLQCGFCTPGMIMTAADLLQHNKKPTDEEVRVALEGNFCRCTGYQNIVKSVQYAAEKMTARKKIKKEATI